jgi:DHA1 family tetracycline resistance protein-like MFS transporter
MRPMSPAENPQSTPRQRTAAMPFIMLTVLIDMVSIGLIIPVLAPLVGTFTGSQTDQAFWYGMVSLAFGVANFFGSPVLGAASDHFGRRPVLLLGFTGLALSFFVTGLATAVWMLIAVRLVSGALQANAAVAQAYVADISRPASGPSASACWGHLRHGLRARPGDGRLLGTSACTCPSSWRGLAIVNAIYGVFVLPESLPKERRVRIDWRKANPLASLRRLGETEGIGTLVAVIGLSSLAQFILHTTWVLYTTFKFGWGPKENGWSLFAIGVMAVLVQGA